MSEIVKPTPDAIARAVQLLHGGALVAFPTETVYGLGADATSDQAVAEIFKAKGRPSFNPLIVHVADFDAAETLGQFSDAAKQLAARYWPGPMTLVVPRRADCAISDLVSAGLSSIAIRVPAHRVARDLLRASARPIAAPSANRSGHVSATTPAHVADDLGGSVALILDDGPCMLGLESTVIDTSGSAPVILRPGGLPHDTIRGSLALSTELSASIDKDSPDAAPVSPGLLTSHYAPRAALRLNARDVRKGEALLAFGSNLPAHDGAIINLSPSGDLNEAAANLFAALRQRDRDGATQIAVMPIRDDGPDRGIAQAINDRLTRAAAPRPA